MTHPLTTQAMIDELQERFGDKTLSFGCEVLLKNKRTRVIEGHEDEIYEQPHGFKQLVLAKEDCEHCGDWYLNFIQKEKIDIIGHPLDLTRVLNSQKSTLPFGEIISNWNLNRHLLRDQSPETIAFVYSLLCPKDE